MKTKRTLVEELNQARNQLATVRFLLDLERNISKHNRQYADEYSERYTDVCALLVERDQRIDDLLEIIENQKQELTAMATEHDGYRRLVELRERLTFGSDEVA